MYRDPSVLFLPPVNRRSRSAAKSAFATGSVAIHIRRDVIGTQFTGVSGIRARWPIRCNETVEHARRHKFGQSSRLISPAGGRSARMVHPLPRLTRSSVSAPDPSILPYSLPLFLGSVSSRSAGFVPGAVTCPQLTANGEQDRLGRGEAR